MNGPRTQRMVSRRAFLAGAGLALGGAALVSSYREMGLDASAGQIREEVVTVPIPNLPAAFDGYTIGFFTDIHLGIWVPTEWVVSGLDRIRAHKPDLLVLGGDYILATENPLWPMLGWVRNPRYAGMDVSDSIPFLFADAAELLSTYRPRDGVVAVIGNHERWNSIDLFWKAFNAHPGIRVLVNEEISIVRGEQQLLVFGSDDFLTGIPRELPAVPQVPKRICRVVVSHNPDYVSALLRQETPAFSFAMCGHTHGGQICLPGMTGLAAPVNDRRFVSGMVEVSGKQVYTSRGLGVVGVPFRLNCPPEVTIFRLQTA